MYIIKVRDNLIKINRQNPNYYKYLHAIVFSLNDINKWKTCLFTYPTLEEAKQAVQKQQSRGKDSQTKNIFIRDYKICSKDGRKETTVYDEIYSNPDNTIKMTQEIKNDIIDDYIAYKKEGLA